MAVIRSNSSSLVIASGKVSVSSSAYLRRLNLRVVARAGLPPFELFLVTAAFIFPILRVVLFVRHDFEHKDALHFITYTGNQAVMIALDIEDRTCAHRIGMPEIHPHVSQRLPGGFLCDTIPMQQRVFRLQVRCKGYALTAGGAIFCLLLFGASRSSDKH